jgi:hypothetical protein
MKIIDAFWEKRNLGITTQEVIVDYNDNIEEVFSEVRNLNAEYIVLKLPVERVDMYFKAAESGFVFVEAMNDIVHNLKLPQLNEYKRSIVENTEFVPMNKADIDVMIKNIGNGMFKTDRIALDPYFSVEKASKRYIGWINDEIERKCELYKFVYNNENVGFTGFKNIDGDEYHEFIAGIYSDFIGKGYAVNMTYKLVAEIIKRNGKKSTTTISSNNVKSLQSRLKYGFLIDKTNYVFVKHRK